MTARFIPSGRLFSALLLSALLIALQPSAGLAAGLGLLILFAIDAARARLSGAPEMELAIPGRMGQEEEGEVRVRFRNPIDRVLRMRLVLDLPAELAGDLASDVRALEIPPRGRVEVGFALLARARGEHRIPALHLRVLGPLRLAWWQSAERIDRTVVVIPGLREVRSYRLLALHQHLQLAGLRNARLRGEGGAFESLREYVRGDDPRHLSWKASARHGTYIVRQYEAERSQSIVLCIDTGRLMAEPVGGTRRLDKALAAAVVLNEVARVWNDQVGVFAFSDRTQAILPPGRYPPDRIPALFARLQARSVEPDYPRALLRLSRLITRRSLLVFFGDVIDDQVSAPLAAQLARLARRHLPLFIALQNSDLFQAARSPVPDRKSAYRRAAALELVLARARTLARMRENGIWVTDVPPDGAVAAAVNRTIEIKRRGAL